MGSHADKHGMLICRYKHGSAAECITSESYRLHYILALAYAHRLTCAYAGLRAGLCT